MDWSAWKEVVRPFLSAPLLLAASTVAGIAIFIITWWLRGHIIKEHLKLLRSQQDDLNAKLGKAKAELLDLEKHLATRASRTTLSDHVISTATLFGDMQIIINDMEATLAHLNQPRSDVNAADRDVA
jgi:predicted secreted protein